MVLRQLAPVPQASRNGNTRPAKESAVLQRDLSYDFALLARGEGNYLVLEDGRKIFDGSGGAAVGCLGWGNQRVTEAVMKQVLAIPYCATVFYTTSVQEELCRYLVESTKGHMGRAYIVNSGEHREPISSRTSMLTIQGSEAMEAAVKLARQYFLELTPSQPQRTRFISRRQSYHGITLGALAVGGHDYRRAKFEPLLMKNATRVSPCNAYRGKNPGETDEDYVARLAKELDDEFQTVGPDTVCAFIAEPVVGAVSSLGASRFTWR
jgi:Adenosylmethionine-8-amino-7-oxononanoate aminotransferase